MLGPETISALDRFRGVPYGTPVCPAPSINLHFSQLGVVTACCFNRSQVLGVYPENTVEEIWRGEPAQELREALSGYDLTRGCEKCAQQIEARDFGGSHAVFYTNYARITADKRREWGMHPEGDPAAAPLPMRLEFNIHNACNLQCVMCHGLASSSIRSHREGLPSLANPYDERFVDQIEPFLPYVVEADFMGGEPFMIPVYRMLWERIAVANPRMRVCILTNATILDDSIKELLERINCWMHVSIDSVVKETYESIRRGASFDTVMENCRYYRDLMRERGQSSMWRYCPMRVNWREIPEAVRFCNEQGILLMFNQVDSPLSLSLHTLSPPELRTVVSYLSEHAPPEGKSEAEVHNRETYLELVHRLTGFLDGRTRLNGLRSRIATSEAVIGRYTKSKKKKVAKGVTVPVGDGTAGILVEASRQYVTTRLNVDQARRTEPSLPEELQRTVPDRRAELMELLADTDEQTFVRVFLSELVRTHASVWGVRQVHPIRTFETIAELAAALAERPDRGHLLEELLDAPPRELYDLLSSSTAEETLGLLGPGAH